MAGNTEADRQSAKVAIEYFTDALIALDLPSQAHALQLGIREVRCGHPMLQVDAEVKMRGALLAGLARLIERFQ